MESLNSKGEISQSHWVDLIVQDKRMSTVALSRILLTLLELTEINKGTEDGVYTVIDYVALYSLY